MKLVLSGLVVLLLSGCVLPDGQEGPDQMAPQLELRPVAFADLPGWRNDLQDNSLVSLQRSCDKIRFWSPDKHIGSDPRMGNGQDWNGICQAIPDQSVSGQMGPSAEAARQFYETYFIPYRMSNNGNSEGLFTGYYEPTLHGSLTRSGRYSVPLLARPSDLVMVNLGEFRDDLKGKRIAGRVVSGQLKPYEDRARIEDGGLPKDMAVPLVWVDNAVDAFFLQIQGSGVVEMESGETMRVGYDGQNGHVYTAIGKELIARGALTKETVSMQTIRAWLAEHPVEAKDVMRMNKSYVFFRRLDTDGPVGAQGVVLTARRSLAVDPVFVPYGVPVFLDVQSPDAQQPNIQTLVIAQDTGGAILGPVRGDLFWGYGDMAAHMAGLMKSSGQAFVLLPRAAAQR